MQKFDEWVRAGPFEEEEDKWRRVHQQCFSINKVSLNTEARFLLHTTWWITFSLDVELPSIATDDKPWLCCVTQRRAQSWLEVWGGLTHNYDVDDENMMACQQNSPGCNDFRSSEHGRFIFGWLAVSVHGIILLLSSNILVHYSLRYLKKIFCGGQSEAAVQQFWWKLGRKYRRRKI